MGGGNSVHQHTHAGIPRETGSAKESDGIKKTIQPNWAEMEFDDIRDVSENDGKRRDFGAFTRLGFRDKD
jgi:hypothetical protein